MTSSAKLLRLELGYETPVAQTNIAAAALEGQRGMFGQEASIQGFGDVARILGGLAKPDKGKLRRAIRSLHSHGSEITLFLSGAPLVQLGLINHSLLLHLGGEHSSDSGDQFNGSFSGAVTR
ncbi:MAG: hypothetical protein H2043_18465 [Rhizobiales bacterium]|nr:hypothetical protein [Hyphomicrobiales bacterium]